METKLYTVVLQVHKKEGQITTNAITIDIASTTETQAMLAADKIAKEHGFVVISRFAKPNANV